MLCVLGYVASHSHARLWRRDLYTTPNLQMGRMRLSGVKGLAQGHTTWCDEAGVDPGWPLSEASPFTAQPATLSCPRQGFLTVPWVCPGSPPPSHASVCCLPAYFHCVYCVPGAALGISYTLIHLPFPNVVCALGISVIPI